MTGFIAFAVVIALAGVAWRWRLGRARSHPSAKPQTFQHTEPLAALIAPGDLAELQAIGNQVAAEYASTSPVVLHSRLRRLLTRRVPIRAITSGGTVGLARVSFADGHTLIVRGQRTGELARLAVGLAWSPVEFVGFHDEEPGIVVELRGRSGGCSVLAIALGESPEA